MATQPCFWTRRGNRRDCGRAWWSATAQSPLAHRGKSALKFLKGKSDSRLRTYETQWGKLSGIHLPPAIRTGGLGTGTLDKLGHDALALLHFLIFLKKILFLLVNAIICINLKIPEFGNDSSLDMCVCVCVYSFTFYFWFTSPFSLELTTWLRTGARPCFCWSSDGQNVFLPKWTFPK